MTSPSFPPDSKLNDGAIASDRQADSAERRSSLLSLVDQIKQWGAELGFQQIGITDTELAEHRQHYQHWLSQSFHGEMHYMAERAELRFSPEQLHPNTLRVISARMDYFQDEYSDLSLLEQRDRAYISRYALGRDYHKLIRKRLATLADKIAVYAAEHLYFSSASRPFVDSAPVLERAFAQKAHLGWIGKNTMLINQRAGSWFFLGELLTNIPLPIDAPKAENHCGSCSACLDICPTQAFNAPYQLDARRCISYLTIELKGEIPEEFRSAMGNRVFGCDDCQLVCPWNKFAQSTQEDDFKPRHGLSDASLLTLFMWTEQEFDRFTQGSAIRRIGYERWLRNIAIGLGNGSASENAIASLKQRLGFSPMVDTHIHWALNKLNHSA